MFLECKFAHLKNRSQVENLNFELTTFQIVTHVPIWLVREKKIKTKK
jgi:hypothetical protein